MNHSLRLIAILLVALRSILHAQGSAADGTWRSYEVYEPVIERYSVCNPSTQALQYNHCISTVFVKDRWIALWSAILRPEESKRGQRIHMSTSLDGKTRAAPELRL